MPRRNLDQQHSIVEAAHEYNIMLDSREIFLHGEVGEDLSKGFLTNLQILLSRTDEAPITIHQFGLGGDWCSGVAIFDAITLCPCPIVFVCHGIAASMSSIIPMACSQREQAYCINMPNCDWLIHDGTTGIMQDMTHKQAQSWSEWEKRLKEDTLDWYTLSCSEGEVYKNRSDKQIRASIKQKLDSKEDWWLTAREAVEHGFADAILGDEGFASLKEIRSEFI